jgi:amino acid adenylation domain-containing protein
MTSAGGNRLSKLNVEDIYPLSPGQQGMLMVLLLSGSRSEVYFDQCVLTVGGDLDVGAWHRAWQQVVDRHPSLRTLFLWEGREQPLQVVRRQAQIGCAEHDWRDLPEVGREERLEAFLREDRERGFDLAQPPLTRLAVIRWSDDEWRVVWSFHHLIVDGWSLSRVLGEAVSFYGAMREGTELKIEAPQRYRDYIAWVQRQDLGRAETFWREALRGFDEATPLPYDGTGSGGESWDYGRETGWIPREETEALSALARGQQLTLNTLVQGAWGTLLGRATSHADVVFGSVVSGRPAEVDGIESVVGFFINVLPVRVRVGDEAVLPALADLQRQQIEQRDYEYCPLESVQAWSELPRGSRLIESLLVFQSFPLNPLEVTALPGIRILGSQVRGATHYPITLYVAPYEGGLDLRLDYHRSRLDAASARRLLGQLRSVLAGFAGQPGTRLDEMPLVTAEERSELIAQGVGPTVPPADVCIHHLVFEQAVRTPDATAVEMGERSLTYRELTERAGLLANRLRRMDVGPESLVGLCVERSPEMVVGMLGTLEAGGAYLPLDPAYPRERLAFMLDDSGARVVLTQESLADRLPVGGREVVRLDADWSSIAAEPPITGPEPVPGNLAFVIYTSGSTGRPKGVLVPHSPLVNYVRSAAEECGIGPRDRVLQFASMSFDTSAEEIYPCLTRGGTLVLRDDAMAGSPEVFLRETERLGITVLDLPTAYWHELVAGNLVLPKSVRLVILGGEQAQKQRLDAWRERVGERARLLNTYGPTEATIVSTRRDITRSWDFPGEVPIGRPIAGARAHVLGPDFEPLPPGLDGELFLGGAGITRGYLGRPDLTAERFVPDPFYGPGERLYRSGDLARLLPGGDLEFRGRADRQVKVRGFRIEPGEIESALRNLDSVRDAVALVREDRLVAYVVPSGETAPSVSGLRAGLKASLPEHMIPALFVTLEALPLTPSGKVDRRALPAPGAERPDVDSDFAAPRNPVEEVLAGIFGEVLKLDRVGVHDDFFMLGGHSLLVAQVSTRVRQALHAELPIVEIFRNPTVAQLAVRVETASADAGLSDLPPIRRVPRDGRPIPLSFPQERVWFLDQLTPGGNIAYNFQVTLYFEGPLHIGVLEETLTELIRRHEILRTSFPSVSGRPAQRIHPPMPVRLPLVDLRDVPGPEREDAAERIIAETLAVPFDVTRLPLIRWRLLQLGDDLHVLVQVEHHFVHDGWSYAVMLREMKALYSAFLRGEPSPLPELPVQYADFAVWQREWLEGEPMRRLLGFWTERLASRPTPTEIPTDRPRPARATFSGDVQMFEIPSDLYMELRQLSRRQGFTLYMTMLAGFFSVLNRYSGEEDLMIGTSNANRRAREIEGMIGMVVNTLILRGDVSGQPSFRDIQGRVRDLTLEVYTHQDMPFERLVQELRPERQLGRNPLFQIMYNFHDAAVPDLELGELRIVRRVRGNRSAKVDLNVIVVPRGEQRVGMEARAEDRRAVLHWEYNTDLFDLETMRRLFGHYMNLLAGAARDPNVKLADLPLLGEAETAELIAGWSRGGPVPDGKQREDRLHTLFEAQVERSPDAEALVCGRERLSYAELNRRANRLAHHLRSLGVGPEVKVGIFLDRTVELVVAILAALKAGGAYVPLDPEYPAERVAFMLEDTSAPVLITRSALESRLPEHGARIVRVEEERALDESNPESGVEAGNLAYLIYTSGSTGRPKAVALEHRGAAAFVRWAKGEFSPAELAGVLAATSVCFDLSVFELFVPLAWGGKVILAANALALPTLPAAAEVTLVNTVPSAMAELVRRRELPASVRTVNLAGEPLRGSLVQEIYATSTAERVLNLYGPSEDTTYSTWGLAPRGAELEPSIGRPLPGTQAYLVDRSFRPIPRGVAGELFLGGAGLARGYFRRPELTAERFVPDPWSEAPGGRLYRTGDLARFRPGGEIEYLGRADHQVKLRGFRIELGEIETALGKVPGVRESVVVLRNGSGEHHLARLVAYVGGEEGGVPAARELRELLARRLPSFMVPSDFVRLDRLPLTPSGKVDRRALPDPEPPRPEDAAVYVAPRNPVEETLAGIWTEVLGMEPVSVRDDFFDLGGHSLSAARVLSRVRDLLRVEVALPAVFERRTIERMADLISTLERSSPAERSLTGPTEELELVAQAAALSDADLDSLLEQMMEGGNS